MIEFLWMMVIVFSCEKVGGEEYEMQDKSIFESVFFESIFVWQEASLFVCVHVGPQSPLRVGRGSVLQRAKLDLVQPQLEPERKQNAF